MLNKLIEGRDKKPIEITADGKGVRFDVYAEDDENVIYDVEMRNAKRDSLPKRIRYSQGMIDLNLIERGKQYNELNRSYVIYICGFNLFEGSKRHKYSFVNLCQEDPTIELGDETERIVLCSEGELDDVSEDMKVFLKYISQGVSGDRFTDALEREVKEARLHKKWRVEYMTLLEHYEMERKEGLNIGIIGAVAIMREDGKSDQEIVERLVRTYGLSEDEAGKFAAGDIQK